MSLLLLVLLKKLFKKHKKSKITPTKTCEKCSKSMIYKELLKIPDEHVHDKIENSYNWFHKKQKPNKILIHTENKLIKKFLLMTLNKKKFAKSPLKNKKNVFIIKLKISKKNQKKQKPKSHILKAIDNGKEKLCANSLLLKKLKLNKE